MNISLLHIKYTERRSERSSSDSRPSNKRPVQTNTSSRRRNLNQRSALPASAHAIYDGPYLGTPTPPDSSFSISFVHGQSANQRQHFASLDQQQQQAMSSSAMSFYHSPQYAQYEQFTDPNYTGAYIVLRKFL